jgi:ADP-heptose:LPS heptosyltransferase
LLTRLTSAVRRRVSNASLRIVSPKAVTSLSRLLAKSPSSSVAVKDARSIVVVRSDGIGDLVLMSPFLRELRGSNPGAWITLVVDEKFRNLVELCPHVNEVLGFDLNYRGRTVVPALVLRALRLSIRHLRPRRFDLALVPRWDVDLYHSAYLAHFCGASCRVAYSENVLPEKQLSNRDFDSLLTRTVDDRTRKHELERNLDFLCEAGGTVEDNRLEVWLSEEDRAFAKKALASRGLAPSDLLIGLAPGAGARKRLWPLNRFVELGRILQKELGARLIVIGGAEDRERGIGLQEELGAAAGSFAGEMTLRQTAAILEHTPLVIANDSGPMHLAAAAGAAIVEISCHPTSGEPGHANSPQRFGPWVQGCVVLQPIEATEPCTSACGGDEAHCILGVSVEMVEAAARKLLATRQRRSIVEAGERRAT